MPIGRFYSDTPLTPGKMIFLEGQELHHLAHVLRLKKGDRVEIVNGRGELGQGEITKVQKNSCTIDLKKIENAPPQKGQVVLVQAIPRLNRLELIVEKCTELGIKELRLFPGDKGERAQLTEQRMSRLQTIAIGAMKQCGRLYLPNITLQPPLHQWESFPECCYFGDLNPKAPSLIRTWEQNQQKGSAFFFIGPESGFSDEEIRQLYKQGAKGVSLNDNVLRTDTAAIASVAILSILMKH